MISEWMGGGLFLLGTLWAVPAWYMGKFAGMREHLRRRRSYHGD